MAGGGGGYRNRQVRETLEYWAGKLAEAEAEEQTGGRNRAYRFVIRDV